MTAPRTLMGQPTLPTQVLHFLRSCNQSGCCLTCLKGVLMHRVAACLAGPRLRCVAPLPTARPLLLSWLLSLAQAVADLTRLIQVVFLLTPVVCWAPLALQYGYCRHQWMHHFRYKTTLKTSYMSSLHKVAIWHSLVCMPEGNRKKFPAGCNCHMALIASAHAVVLLLVYTSCKKLRSVMGLWMLFWVCLHSFASYSTPVAIAAA